MARPPSIKRYCRLTTKLNKRTLSLCRWVVEPKFASRYTFPEWPDLEWWLEEVYSQAAHLHGSPIRVSPPEELGVRSTGTWGCAGCRR